MLKFYPNYRQVLLVFLLVFVPFLLFSQIPQYYDGVDFNTTSENIKIQLSTLITDTHITDLPYTSSELDTWDAVKQTDEFAGDPTHVLLFYGYDDYDGNPATDYTRDKSLSCHATPCTGLWNREHVYPKSIATPDLITSSPGSGTDVHNLRACAGTMNTTRSNRLFEDGSGNAHITGSGSWYPGDEWKGDVARIIMYMYVRYPSQCVANNIGVGGNSYSVDMPDVFLDWNAEDPVSAYEIQRNEVLENIQGNRNPFIDNPYLATLIWGGMQAQDTWNLLDFQDVLQQKIKVYPTIVSDRLFVSNITDPNLEIVVYSINGKRFDMSLINNQLDVEQLQSGIYFLKVVESERVSTFKFLVR